METLISIMGLLGVLAINAVLHWKNKILWCSFGGRLKIPPTLGEVMRNHRISLQDIATLAGVTKMTVSRYIRSPKKVAKETGERIAKIME